MIHHLLPTAKFIPSEFHHSFFDIDFSALHAKGYRLIVTDLDNTLVSYEESTPTKEIEAKFEELQTIGFDVVLLSNNHPDRLNHFCKDIHCKGFAGAKKPLLYGFKKALNSVPGATKETTVIIGDQLMTDIWGANRFGVTSILVNPLKKKTEKWYTKFNRSIERDVIADIKKKYPEAYRTLGLSERK